MNKIIKTDQEWKEILSEEEYYVTRQKGTEPAFSGKAFDISKDGIFNLIYLINNYLTITKSEKV